MLQVRCVSHSALAEEWPREKSALIVVADPTQSRPPLEGWGPTLMTRFYDREVPEHRVAATGWTQLRDDGYFVPEKAVMLRRWLSCDVVQECEELVVACPNGRSRSISIGRYASGTFGSRLVHENNPAMNLTVYALLRNPQALDPAPPSSGDSGWGNSIPGLFDGSPPSRATLPARSSLGFAVASSR